VSRITLPVAAAALCFMASPVLAQQPVAPCPEVDSAGETPVEVRVLGMVIRAHVNAAGTTAAGDSARLDARLVSCEDVSRIGADPDAAAAGDGLLRLLSDLRLGIQLAPSADGRCFRAQIEVADDGPDARRSRVEEPVGIELCGLPIGRSAVGAEPARRM
jgi:hypothetical protein